MPITTRSSWVTVPALAAALASGCLPETDATPPVDEVVQKVVGGTNAGGCQFPSVVLVLLTGGLCSGTLVNSKLVTFAAHCQLAGTVRAIYFGENASSPTRKVDVEHCNFFPDYKPNVNDVAYCVLKDEVKDIPIAPVLMGCETNVLRKGKMVDLVGFGITSMSQPRSYGIKRFAQVPLLSTPDANATIAQVGTSSSNGCEGDSGGPILVKLDDGTFRMAGIASTTAVSDSGGPDAECISPTNYVLAHHWIDWIEKDSGVDITPCYDADGNWSPSASCGKFSMAADSTSGTWDQGCNYAGAESAGPSTVCGPAAYASTGDGGAPPADVRFDARPDTSATTVHPDAAPSTPGVTPDPSAPTPSRALGDAGAGDDATPTLGLPEVHGNGCSCRLGSSDGVPGGLPLLAGGAIALALARRRRRS